MSLNLAVTDNCIKLDDLRVEGRVVNWHRCGGWKNSKSVDAIEIKKHLAKAYYGFAS